MHEWFSSLCFYYSLMNLINVFRCEDHQFKDDIAIIQKRPEVQEAMTKLRAALPSRVEENGKIIIYFI